MAGPRHDPGGPSLEGLAGVVVGFPLAYLAAEGLLPGPMHPVHWLITALGAGAGYVAGTAVAYLKDRRELHGSFFGRTLSRRERRARPLSSRRGR